MKTKSKIWIYPIAILGVFLLFTNSCKKSEVAKYNLTVTKGEGVSGTPEEGTYSYNSGESVQYNYNSQTGYINFKISLDNDSIPANGVITMNADHTIQVSANKDVSGNYTGTTSQGYPIRISVIKEGDKNKEINIAFKIKATNENGWTVVYNFDLNISEFLDKDYIAFYSYSNNDISFGLTANFSGGCGYVLCGNFPYFRSNQGVAGIYTANFVQFTGSKD